MKKLDEYYEIMKESDFNDVIEDDEIVKAKFINIHDDKEYAGKFEFVPLKDYIYDDLRLYDY
jgi:hypothetical protein